MQVKRSPIALWISAAATLESTPPDSPQITRPSLPTWVRIRATASSTKLAIDQSPFALQMPNKKLPSNSAPRGVCTTSGWNWTQWIRFAAFAKPENLQFSLSAV